MVYFKFNHSCFTHIHPNVLIQAYNISFTRSFTIFLSQLYEPFLLIYHRLSVITSRVKLSDNALAQAYVPLYLCSRSWLMLITHINLKNIQKSRVKTSIKVSKSIKKPKKNPISVNFLFFKSNTSKIEQNRVTVLK